MANPVTLRAWTVDDVGRWLSSINLTHLVHKFEVANITGDQLYRMDDGPLPQQLKLNPAEKLTIQASIRLLKESSIRSMTIPPNSTRYGEILPRQRSSSDSKRKRSMRQCESENSGIDDNQPPEPKPGPVGDLLDDNCRHSGWIRKRGGGYKSWKHRYLVLRLGFVYYFENDRSKQPKGHFSLYNCRVLPCSEEDKIPKQFKWVFKIVPNNPKHRTYLVTTPAKHEMEKWMDAINKEIQRFSGKVLEKSFPSTEIDTQEVEEEEEEKDKDEQDYEHIYDPVYEDEDDDDDHYEDPKDFYEDMTQDEDDPYSRVRDLSMNVPSPPSFPPPLDSHFSPPHTSWQMADPKQPRKGKGDAPIIPPRSERSLHQSNKSEKLTKSPPHTPGTVEEDPYLTILGKNEMPGSHRMGGGNLPPRLSMTGSPQLSPRPPPEMPPIDNGHPLSDSDIADTEEEDPYYIRLQTFDEVLPENCMFDNLSREDSDRLLMKTSRPGTYLLRDGTHKGAKHVLSVWTINGSKHYKLYEKDSGYCLTEGKPFQTIYQLIEYYKQEDLPKTPNVKLTDPFHPADH